MSEAPPLEPAVDFEVMSARRIRSHIWNLLLFGAVASCSGITIPTSLLKGRSIILDVVFIFIGAFFFITTAMSWYRDQGAKVRVQGNSISVISPTGKTRMSGLFSNIVLLKGLRSVSQKEPRLYVVLFAGGKRLMFDRNLQNLPELLKLIEERSGQQFVIQQS